MTEFLLDIKKQKKECIAAGQHGLSSDELDELKQKYTAILDQGDKEYQAAIEGKKNIKRFREEYCLLIRLRKYMDEHLRFMSDFNAPFGNQAAEQGAHFMKNKTRVAGGFRSSEGAKNHMIIASILATAKKQKKNLYSTIKNSFIGNTLFDNS